LPLGVTMAQELAPRGRSMVSSLMMGLAFGTGGLMAPLTGMAAELFSIRSVLCALAALPLVTVVLIALVPDRPPQQSAST
jgi:FSR family fosmidomycin resistance protein-like MFS transporter